jgi:hypothetical protein
MIGCLLMVMVRDDCLLVNSNGERWLLVCANNHLSPWPLTNTQSSLTININKQTIFSHHYHQQTNNHLLLLQLTINQSSVTITIKMIVCLLMIMVRDDCLLMVMVRGDWLFVNGNGERHNHLSPLTSTNKQSSLTITINKQTIISYYYH